MTDEIVASDMVLVELLRKQGTMSVTDLASALEVTATAIRQRLTRLMARGSSSGRRLGQVGVVQAIPMR